MNILKRIRYAALSVVMLFAFSAAPVAVIGGVASAQKSDIQRCLDQGADLDASGIGEGNCPNGGGGASGPGSRKIGELLKTVINVFSWVVAVIAVIMIIYGGLRYITSGGDSGKVGNAKNTIIYALIGLVVVALAQFIVQFVLEKITS